MSLVFNNYDDTIADPVAFKQLAVRDALFLHYRCPQVDKHIQLFSHYKNQGTKFKQFAMGEVNKFVFSLVM